MARSNRKKLKREKFHFTQRKKNHTYGIIENRQMRRLVELSFILFITLTVVHAGGFYSMVETKVPLSGVVKTIVGVSHRVCVLKCRLSKKCEYSAIDLEKADCLHLNKINVSDGEQTVNVNLILEAKTNLKVSGTLNYAYTMQKQLFLPAFHYSMI